MEGLNLYLDLAGTIGGGIPFAAGDGDVDLDVEDLFCVRCLDELFVVVVDFAFELEEEGFVLPFKASSRSLSFRLASFNLRTAGSSCDDDVNGACRVVFENDDELDGFLASVEDALDLALEVEVEVEMLATDATLIFSLMFLSDVICDSSEEKLIADFGRPQA